MPRFTVDQLREIARRIVLATGSPPHEAELVAEELAAANLEGHDSHGIMRLKPYVKFVEEGVLRPGGKVTVAVDRPALVVLDGGYNYGQVVARAALELASKRVREAGAFVVLCRNSLHIGRLGSYTRRAALSGYAAMLVVSGPRGGGVAPWGGLERRLGTNPFSFAAPANPEPIVVDTTTSATAEGKLRVAVQKGQRIPEGWIIDAAGRPSTDPQDYYRGGSILPLGGPMGHKGYALAVAIDLLASVLSGYGVGRLDLPAGANSFMMLLVDIGQLMDPAEYRRWLDRYVEWLKSSRLAPGFAEILLPGEPEARARRGRAAEGIELPEATWSDLLAIAAKLGVSLADIQPG